MRAEERRTRYRRSRPRRILGGMAAIAAAFMIVACSSSSKSNSSGTTSASPTSNGSPTSGGSGTTAAPATGSQWVIGTVGSYTGPEASSLGPTQATMNAWAQWVNAGGGINGHPVKLINIDDHGDPAVSTSAVKQLVEQDHVIAIVGENSIVDAAWASYVQQKGVPVLGASVFNIAYITNPDFYPNGTTVIAAQYGELAEAKKLGKTHFGNLYCAEAAACAQSIALFKKLAPTAGVDITYSAQVSATAPNYTAQCLGAKEAGVDALGVGADSNTVLRVYSGCAQQGYSAQVVNNDGTVTKAWQSNRAVNGAVTVQPDFPVYDNSTSAEQEFHNAMQKYAPQVINGQGFGPNEAEDWTSGLLFEAAAKAANLGDNPTSAQLVQGLHALKNETLDGLAPPLTFQQGPHQVNCWFVMGVKNGQFTAPQGLKTDCQPGVPASS